MPSRPRKIAQHKGRWTKPLRGIVVVRIVIAIVGERVRWEVRALLFVMASERVSMEWLLAARSI